MLSECWAKVTMLTTTHWLSIGQLLSGNSLGPLTSIRICCCTCSICWVLSVICTGRYRIIKNHTITRGSAEGHGTLCSLYKGIERNTQTKTMRWHKVADGGPIRQYDASLKQILINLFKCDKRHEYTLSPILSRGKLNNEMNCRTRI